MERKTNKLSNDFRLKYYLNNVYDNKITISTGTQDTICLTFDNIDHHLNIPHKKHYPNYIHPIQRIWMQLNEKYKKCKLLLLPEDNQSYTEKGTLAKDRYFDDKNAVILKLDDGRHFGDIKKIPPIDIPFSEKQNIIIWRGVSTGNSKKKGNRFTLTSKYVNYDESKINVGFNELVQMSDSQKQNHKQFVKKSMSIKDQLKCKYILSIEGNDVASGLKWQLYSNSVVIMPKPNMVSWAMEDQLIPYVHYVPVNDEFSDLEEIYEWCINHDKECEQISKNATEYIEQFLDEKNETFLQQEILKKYFDNVTIN